MAGYELVTYTVATPEQSTFNLQPGYTYDLTVTPSQLESISWHFQETGGSPVSFYILGST